VAGPTMGCPMETPAPTSFPGLAKIRGVPLVQRRRIELRTAHEGRWREILDAADVVSEGRARQEGASLVYYGSTSVLLPRRSAGGLLPDLDVASLTAVLRLDPHVRLRALRIAHREAQARAGASMRMMLAEIQINETRRGVIIAIEVTARLARPLRSVTRDEEPRAASAPPALR
jgi:hypothetical protein